MNKKIIRYKKVLSIFCMAAVVFGLFGVVPIDVLAAGNAPFKVYVNGKELKEFSEGIYEYFVPADKNAGAPKVTAEGMGGVGIEQAKKVPDCAIITYNQREYKIRFVQNDTWTTIKADGNKIVINSPSDELADPYYGDKTGVPEREWNYDYSQTYITKIDVAAPSPGLSRNEDMNNPDSFSVPSVRFDDVLELVKELDAVTVGVHKIIYLSGWQGYGHGGQPGCR